MNKPADVIEYDRAYTQAYAQVDQQVYNQVDHQVFEQVYRQGIDFIGGQIYDYLRELNDE